MVLWGTLIAYLAIMVGIGIYCRKKTSNVDDFVLGGRSIGPWFTAFAYGTSYFSAVVFVGYAGQFGWEYGLASTWIGLGNAFIGSLLAWFLLGKRTRIMSKYLQTSTMPEFFEKRYLSKPLKLSSAIIILFSLSPTQLPFITVCHVFLKQLSIYPIPPVSWRWRCSPQYT